MKVVNYKVGDLFEYFKFGLYHFPLSLENFF
jgi:hypothetical protein